MKTRSIYFLFLLFVGVHVGAQQPLRRFLQPANIINKIPYGNNPVAAHTVQSVDATIYYEVYGKGTPIVLLHGGLFGSTIEMAEMIDSLSKHFQVIAISTRGHGKSAIGHIALSLEQRANDVLAVINQVTKEKVMVLGFSDGGYSAYQFAAMYPNRVAKMVVMGAGILYPGMRTFNITVQMAVEMDTAYWHQQLKLMPEPNRLEEVFSQISTYYEQLTVGKECLSAIQCPVLVMAGDRDEGNSVQHVVDAAMLIPHHQIAIIPNASHTVFLDNFKAVWASILPFIQ